MPHGVLSSLLKGVKICIYITNEVHFNLNLCFETYKKGYSNLVLLQIN